MIYSKFNILFEKVIAQLITESGHMFPDCSMIKRENIAPTIKKIDEEIFTPLGISHDLWSAEIGSAAEGGKKDECGDLDIAVNFKKIGEDLHVEDAKKMIEDYAISHGYEISKASNLMSVRFPIQGTQLQNGEFAQVDLFNAGNIKYTEFIKYSPRLNRTDATLKSDESKYKGVHRIIVLASLIKAVSLAIADDAEDRTEYLDKNGRKYPAYRHKYISILNDSGIYEVTKTFLGKSGKFKKDPEEDKSKRQFITTDPQEALDLIFGKGVFSVADTYSFESIWNNIIFSPKFPYKDKIDEICTALWHSIDDLRKKDDTLEMPIELDEYVTEHKLI